MYVINSNYHIYNDGIGLLVPSPILKNIRINLNLEFIICLYCSLRSSSKLAKELLKYLKAINVICLNISESIYVLS